MIKYAILLIFGLFTLTSHAGWIIAADSDHSGVIKVSQLNKRELLIERCSSMKSKVCHEIGIVSSMDRKIRQTVDIIQVGGAGVSNAAPVIVAFLGWAEFVVLDSALSLGIGTGMAISGQALLKEFKSMNIIRINDFRRVYTESFISGDTIISFPDDELNEVINAIL